MPQQEMLGEHELLVEGDAHHPAFLPRRLCRYSQMLGFPAPLANRETRAAARHGRVSGGDFAYDAQRPRIAQPAVLAAKYFNSLEPRFYC
jgi:hypothetical protein